MKRLLSGTLLLGLALVFSMPTPARADVEIGVSLPSLIVFASPPEMVVIPETNVYFVPDSDVDIFFTGGWWWRPWEGRWYRSRNYSSGWRAYRNVPSFYRGIPSGWRNDYREHRWKGHPWNSQRVPHQQVQGNWRNWEKTKHWEKQNNWGVEGSQSRPQSRKIQPSRAAEPQSMPKQSGEVKARRDHERKGGR